MGWFPLRDLTCLGDGADDRGGGQEDAALHEAADGTGPVPCLRRSGIWGDGCAVRCLFRARLRPGRASWYHFPPLNPGQIGQQKGRN
jgi:hypothetical protein